MRFFENLNRRLYNYKFINKLFKKVYKIKYHSYISKDYEIEINIDEIYGWYKGSRYKKLPFDNVVVGGDWSDNIKKLKIHERLKYQGVQERFVYNKEWKETTLFRERYIPKIEKGLNVRGFYSVDDLEKYYIENYDKLYMSIKNNGFIYNEKNAIYVNIYKNGEILFTSDGNHRLFICHILGIKTIPVRVWMIHKEWQKKKDKIYKMHCDGNLQIDEKLLNHPDIRILVSQ